MPAVDPGSCPRVDQATSAHIPGAPNTPQHRRINSLHVPRQRRVEGEASYTEASVNEWVTKNVNSAQDSVIRNLRKESEEETVDESLFQHEDLLQPVYSFDMKSLTVL